MATSTSLVHDHVNAAKAPHAPFVEVKHLRLVVRRSPEVRLGPRRMSDGNDESVVEGLVSRGG